MGGLEGVMFEYAEVLVGHRNETMLVRACVQEACEDLTLGRDNHQHGVTVGAELLHDGSPVEASLRIATPSGNTLFKSRMTAHPELFEPNGPNCEPHTWSAQLYASGTDRLRQRFVTKDAR